MKVLDKIRKKSEQSNEPKYLGRTAIEHRIKEIDKSLGAFYFCDTLDKETSGLLPTLIGVWFVVVWDFSCAIRCFVLGDVPKGVFNTLLGVGVIIVAMSLRGQIKKWFKNRKIKKAFMKSESKKLAAYKAYGKELEALTMVREIKMEIEKGLGEDDK